MNIQRQSLHMGSTLTFAIILFLYPKVSEFLTLYISVLEFPKVGHFGPPVEFTSFFLGFLVHSS